MIRLKDSAGLAHQAREAAAKTELTDVDEVTINYFLNISTEIIKNNFAISPVVCADFSTIIGSDFQIALAEPNKETVPTTCYNTIVVGDDSPNRGSICRICHHSMYNRLGESAN